MHLVYDPNNGYHPKRKHNIYHMVYDDIYFSDDVTGHHALYLEEPCRTFKGLDFFRFNMGDGFCPKTQKWKSLPTAFMVASSSIPVGKTSVCRVHKSRWYASGGRSPTKPNEWTFSSAVSTVVTHDHIPKTSRRCCFELSIKKFHKFVDFLLSQSTMSTMSQSAIC